VPVTVYFVNGFWTGARAFQELEARVIATIPATYRGRSCLRFSQLLNSLSHSAMPTFTRTKNILPLLNIEKLLLVVVLST